MTPRETWLGFEVTDIWRRASWRSCQSRMSWIGVEAIISTANRADPVDAAALLGTVPGPCITVTKALELYWTLAREKTLGKSED